MQTPNVTELTRAGRPFVQPPRPKDPQRPSAGRRGRQPSHNHAPRNAEPRTADLSGAG